MASRTATSAPQRDKLWYLRQIDLFSDPGSEEMAWVNRVTRMRTFRRGEPLSLPGDPSDRIYFLKRGRVKVARLSDEWKEITLAILKPGDTIGETCIVDGTPRETLALALEEVSVCAMRKEDLVFRDVNSRIARLLLQLAEEYGEPAPGGIRLRVRITHHEMANLVGATWETVTLTLNTLKRQGFVGFQGRTLFLWDPEALRAYA